MKTIQEIFSGRNVVIIGSKPPAGLALKQDDLVVRINDWVKPDERCDVLVHVGFSPEIKEGPYLSRVLSQQKPVGVIVLSQGGASRGETFKMICECHSTPYFAYEDTVSLLANIRGWFDLRGSAPSSGLAAIVLALKLGAKSVLATGMDFYAHSPKHQGWNRHGPLLHVDYLSLLYQASRVKGPPLRVGEDLWEGVHIWLERARKFEGDFLGLTSFCYI